MESESTAISPSDGELLVALTSLYATDPNLGAEKVHKQLLADNPSWVGKVGLKRVKAVRNANNLISQAPGVPARNSDLPPPYTPNLASSSRLRLDPVRDILRSGGGLHGKSKSPLELQKINEELNRRLANPSPALSGQNEMHMTAQAAGLGFGGGWYALLPDGVEEYEFEKVLWVNTAPMARDDEQAAHAAIVMLERGKAEATLGNAAGAYLVFKGVFTPAQEMGVVKQKKVAISEKRFIRQLDAEYGIDLAGFIRDLDRNPRGTSGRQLMDLLLSMTS
ncbi:hypothetical protein BDW22DRAFT_1356298 [Trametopsis cervina]|nr:hypothetical protein BDW22DRAFT_1356298 [Trametopsis cervina]